MPLPERETGEAESRPDGEAKPPLVAILGPTGVGKTEIAIRLAERLDGEIVSADSRLLYRGMDIGTAKPTPAELARVRHHLVDVAGPEETWSLAVYQRAARQAIADIHARGRLPLLVGGTGQYLWAVIEGWRVPRVSPNPRLRTALERWAAEVGTQGLHARLARLDPQAAERIDYRNLRRTARALEVILLTGRPFSAQSRRGPSPYRALLLGLTRPRAELYARIDARLQAMLAAGFLEEVRGLLERRGSRDWPSLSAIGYREMVDHLEGKTTLEEAVALVRRHSREFIRHQANWFKETDERILWFRVGEQTVSEMEAAILHFLGSGWRGNRID